MFRVLKATRHPITLKGPQRQAVQVPKRRPFSTTPPRMTDGVYKAITDMRIRTPWIEALRKSREGSAGAAPAGPVRPDLAPKKMSDSFVKFVCFCSGGAEGNPEKKKKKISQEILLMEL
jgi:acyl-coenzyme A thioesterase 9